MDFKLFTGATSSYQRFYIYDSLTGGTGLSFKEFTGAPEGYQRWYLFRAIVTGLVTVAWANITGKPTSFPTTLASISDMSADARTRNTKTDAELATRTRELPLYKSHVALATAGGGSPGTGVFTLLWTGDSVSPQSAIVAGQYLQAAYGVHGRALAALAMTPSAGSSVYDSAKWIQAYYSLSSGQNLKFSSTPYLGASDAAVLSSVFSVYILKEAGAGTAKVQFSTNGSSWSDVTIANGANVDLDNVSFDAALSSAVLAFTLPIAFYYIRVLNLTGTTSVLGAKMRDGTHNGVLLAGIVASGRSIADMNACPSATFNPVFTDLNPTLCMYEAKEELSGSALLAQYDIWAAKWAALLPNAE